MPDPVINQDLPYLAALQEESLAELVAEYKNNMGTKPISEAELKDEQTNSTLGLPGSFESVQQLSGAYSNILQYGLPDDYYNTFTEKVLAVTPAAANEIAKKYIQPSFWCGSSSAT